MDVLVGVAGPWSCWLPDPALCRGCWLLVGRAGSWGGCLWNPRGPRASAGSLVGRVEVQKILGLVLAHWWVKPGPGASAVPQMNKAKTWGLAAGPRNPRAGVGSLVGGAGFWHSWLQNLGCSEARVGPLLSGVGAQCVPGLVLACWLLGWVLPGQAAGLQISWGWCLPTGGWGWSQGYSRLAGWGQGPGDSGAGACPLMNRLGSQGLWLQGPGGPGSSACALVCGVGSWAFWSAGPCPGQLWAQGALNQPVCWWVGLCPCPFCCLAWGIPVLLSTGWWVGVGLSSEDNKLEGGFHNGACQQTVSTW